MSNQAYIFLWSFLGGALIAFLYDLFRIRRKAIKTLSVLVYIEDLIYWIAVALIMFAVVYHSNEGEIRGYIFLGAIIGVVMYILLLSRIIIASSMFIIRLVYRVFKFIFLVLTFPFKILFKILGIPARFIYKILARLYRKTRRAGKSNMAKVAAWSRLYNNIRKKI